MANAKEIIGDNFVSALKYEDLKTGEIKEIKTDGVFAAIGYEPNTDLVKNLVEINEEGKIIVDCKTQKLLTKAFGPPATPPMFYITKSTSPSATPSKRR